MRSTAIEEMKELSAEILHKRGYTIENGTLREEGLGDANGLVSDRNHRHYTLPEKAVEEFNSRPPEKRMATLRWPKNEKNTEELRCGTIDALQDTCGHANARVSIDPSLPGGKELKALIEGGKPLVCGLGGYGHCEGEIAVMDSIEYVAISEPHEVPH